MNSRVCVTGVGLVSPLGHTLAAFDEALFAGRSAVVSRTLEMEGLEPMALSLAPCEFDDSERSSSRLPLDRGTAMSLAAARDAWAQATLVETPPESERLGIYWGSGMAGIATYDDSAQTLYVGHRRVRPTAVLTCDAQRCGGGTRAAFSRARRGAHLRLRLRFIGRRDRRGHARHSRRLDRRRHRRRP